MRRISRASGKLILLCTIDFAEFEVRGGNLFANRARNASGVPFIGSSRRYKKGGKRGRDTFLHTEFNAVCCRKVKKKLQSFSFGSSFLPLCVACTSEPLSLSLHRRREEPANNPSTEA